MRLDRAIDRFLSWRQVERDAPPKSIRSYWSVLRRLAEDHPDARLHDFEGSAGTDLIRQTLAKRWAHRSASTRGNVISVFHSFFDWCESEDLIEHNPARKIKRPPERKPDIYRPTEGEMMLGLRATTLLERAPWVLLMQGLRNSELRACRWQDLDLARGRVRVLRKGLNWQWIPLAQTAVDELRTVHIALNPDPDHHVFVVESEQWHQSIRRRVLLDPTQQRSSAALGRMVARVCKRAGIRLLYPHLLRHGFANHFVRLTRRVFGAPDVMTLQTLLGHSRLDTTQAYVDQMRSEEAEDTLRRLEAEQLSQSGLEEPVPPTELATAAMRPAGIEPASGPSGAEEPGGVESDEPRLADKRRPTGRQEEETDADA